jgi:molybdopterin molybdotransferase
MALTGLDPAAIARRVIPVGEALARVCAAAPVLGAERVPLAAALGRVAAEDVASTRAVPGAANSAMDGYAVRAADLANAPVRLRIAAVEPAGVVVETPLAPGTAVKLFTGSVIPPGADTVVRIEDAEERDGGVTVHAGHAPGANIRGAGEDIAPGQVVQRAGTVLGPADIGVLASIGRATVVVHQRPRVAILSTGTELVELDEAPGPGQVVNSNAYTLAAACREAGADPVTFPIVRDRPEEVRARLAEALAADAVLTSGGVSVGDLDFVKAALDAEGVEQLFWRVAQKPGKPLAVGRRGRTIVFGLPGNPVSALVCFYLYVRPALRRMQGHARLHLPVVTAELTAPVRKAKALTEFVRVRLETRCGGWIATAFSSQSSGVLTSLADGAGLLVGPADADALPAGRAYPVLVLGSQFQASDAAPF